MDLGPARELRSDVRAALVEVARDNSRSMDGDLLAAARRRVAEWQGLSNERALAAIELIASGLSLETVADTLHYSRKTIGKDVVMPLKKQLGCRGGSLAQLCVRAVERGWLSTSASSPAVEA
jgi:DNA-binding NarL/FixJ family response regulator